MVTAVVRAEGVDAPGTPVAADSLVRSGVIAGRIVDDTRGEPVSFANVRLDEARRGALADQLGRFRFGGLPFGSYTLRVSRVGYAAYADTVNVTSPDTLKVEVRLRAEELRTNTVKVQGKVAEGDLTAGQAPVSLSGRDLRNRLGGTVAATLAGEAGIAERTMGVAPARPVIRGLSGNRLLVLEDGAGTGDLSATSDDHAVVIEPLHARRIEVIRGPAALLYGSSVLGGVVNIERQGIPVERPEHLQSTLGANTESVNDGVAGQFRIDVPTGPFAWTVEGSGRSAGDVVTPAGTLNNSQLNTWTASGGASWIAGRGYLGAGVNRYESNYGVPGGFLGGHPFGADIELRRTQLETRGAVALRKSGPTQLEGQFVYTRYFHRELESNDVCGVSFGVLTYDASTRLRFDAGRWGAGAVGVAGEYRDYANGCLSFIPPTTEGTLSAFGLDRARAGPIEFQAAARVDARSVTPASEVHNKAGLVRPRDFAGGSGSLAARLPLGKSAGVTVTTSLAFRPPSIEELFSEGPHLAAFAYEIGNADLEAEQGRGVELAFEWNRPSVGLQARGFFNSIDGFIQVFDTGQVEYGPGEDGFLARYQYSGKDSRMAGGELELAWTLQPELQLHASAGYVAGEVVETGVPLPRIPPLNGHLALEWRRGVWGARISTTGATAQNRVGEFEQPTAGYLTLGCAIEWQHAAARRLHSLVLRGQNLTNAEYRNHLSRVKSIMPEPGLSVALLYRLSFF